jgi:hypothetical protein
VKPINLISVVIAVASGVITLLLMFFGETLGFGDTLPILLGWVTTLIAVALLVGVLNLVAVQGRKVSALNLNSAYSVVFFIAFFIVVLMWMLAAAARTFLGTDDPLREQLVGAGQGTVDFAFNYIQTPVEASLTALLAIVMVLAGARLVRTRRSWSAAIFIVVTLILLIGIAPIGGLEILGSLRTSLNDLFVMGASRGLVLAISLGVLATGVRVIIGVDRPYGE